MHWNTGLVFLLLVNLAVFCLTANTATDEERLYKKLFENYNRASRSVMNASEAVDVEFLVSLIRLMNLDAENQVFHTHVWLTQTWKDERLYWNPVDFNGVKYFPISSEIIWRPDLMLYNSVDFKVEKMQGNAVVEYDGTVVWIQSLRLQSSCDMDIRFFPFDRQMCMLKFGSWSYNGFQVNHTLFRNGVDLSDYFVSNTEWKLTEFKAKRYENKYQCCKEVFLDIKLYISIERMPLYYFYSIIVPCVLLTILNLLVFLLPPDTGDKVSLGVTTFLAFSVFMLVIADKVPATSKSVPLVGGYLTMIMILTALSLIMTIFILNLHHVGPHRKRVPRWLHIITYDVLSRILCLKPTASPFQRFNANNAIDDHENEIADEIAKISVASLLKILVEKQITDESRQKNVEEWRFVASVFDRLLFWLFLIVNVAYFAHIMNMPSRG